MKLETERLVLRRFEKKDKDDLFAYLSDEEVMRFEPSLPLAKEGLADELRRRIASPVYIAIEEKASGRVIGNLYLGDRDCASKELGYLLNRNYWKQGYACEACRAIIEYCFARGTHRIYAECDPKNTSSIRLLQRLGFRREAHFRKNIYFRFDGSGKPLWKDTAVYALLQEDPFSVHKS